MNNKNGVIVKNAFPIGFCEGKDGEKTKYNLKIASVPISELEIDHNYQRVACSNVKKLTKIWDEKKCDPLYVSYRKDKFFIMDGQHRYLVAKKKDLHISHVLLVRD